METRLRKRNVGSILLAGVAAVLLAASGTLAVGVAWSPSVGVGPLERIACGHALATTPGVSGTTLHTVYTNGGGSFDTHTVFYRRSFDNGSTWPSGVVLSTDASAYPECPTVASAGSVVVVSWLRWIGSTRTIRLRVSTNGGATWGPERQLPTARTPGRPSVAVVGTRILIAWTDGTGAQQWSRVAVSRDRGVSWTLRALDSQPSAPDIPEQSTTLIAASGTRVFTAWMRSGGTTLVGRASLDSGTTWQAPQILATTFTPTVLDRPYGNSRFSIAARPDRMAITWTGPWTKAMDDVPSLLVRVFAAGAWQAPATLSVPPPAGETLPYGYDSSPVVTLLASARIGLVWNACYDLTSLDPMYSCGETYGGGFDPIWTESSDNGTTWTNAVILDPDPSYTTITAISAVWTSANLRGVLITRWNGEPDWDVQVRFSRGAGLP